MRMSSFKAPCQNGPYTNQHTEQHKITQNTKTQQTFRKKNYGFCFSVFLCKAYIHQCANVSIKPLNNTHSIKTQINCFKQLKSRLNTIIMASILKHVLFCMPQSDASKEIILLSVKYDNTVYA